MTRARDLSNDEANGGGATPPFVAGKNRIINGDFGIWQRGTSFSVSGTYMADRWNTDSDATFTTTRETFTPGTAPVSGYEGTYFYRITKSSGGSYANNRQRIEDVRTFAGQTVTLSFWAKASTSIAIQPYWIQGFGTGGSSGAAGPMGDATLTTSWARYSFTYAAPSIAGKTIGTNHFIDLYVNRYIGSAAVTIDTWGVQLEAGSVATPFTPAGGGFPGAELALCQRYYFRFTAENSATAFFGSATNPTTTQGNAWVQYPVTMRIKPTSVDSASLCIREASGTRRSMSSIVLETNGTNANLAFIYGTISGGTVNIPAQLAADNTTSAYIGFSAEL